MFFIFFYPFGLKLRILVKYNHKCLDEILMFVIVFAISERKCSSLNAFL